MELLNFQLLTISDIVLLSSILLVFLIQIFYVLRFYLNLARHKDKPVNNLQVEITVILSVRNEEERIRQIVTGFENLKFENYQILIINENSEDNTLEILKVLEASNPKLKVTSFSQETQFPEKQVINIGMKGASYQWIIFLTSNSSTINQDWLAGLNNMLGLQTDAVIAYTNIERKSGYRNLMCRLERFNQFMISGAWTLAGMPFVFNQNNILFNKSLYFNTNGFRQKLNLNFANLELIFNENFRTKKVGLTTNPNLAVREIIEDDRGDHIKLIKKAVQIRQSLTSGKKLSLFIDDLTKILLSVLTLANLIIHPEYWITILALPFIHIILLSVSVKVLLSRLNERKIFVSSLVYILIKPIINWWFLWSMYLIHRRSRWN